MATPFKTSTNSALPVSLADALHVKRIDEQNYTATVHPDHSHGNIAHGGFCVSLFQLALYDYFNTKHKSLKQPDTFNLQVTFLSPVPEAEITITLTDIKLTRILSVTHIRLHHAGKDNIVGYAVNTDLDSSMGQTLAVPSPLQPPAPPADLDRMLSNTDPHWIRFVLPWGINALTKTFFHAERWVPRENHQPHISEFWFRQLPHGERITNMMLGSLVDQFIRLPENWRSGSVGGHSAISALAKWQERYGSSLDAEGAGEVPQCIATARNARSGGSTREGNEGPDRDMTMEMTRQAMAYPTIGLTLEIKKRLPKEGVEWLYCRAMTRGIRNGRWDADVILIDRDGEVIATSTQTALMLDVRGSTKFENTNGSSVDSKL